MIILGIETSCDETAAAVLSFDKAQDKQKRIIILSNVVASSAALQAKYGGVIPEQAAREQIKSIIPVIQESLQGTGYSEQDLDAVAVTQGPGLIGSLLVGVETAKTLALVWNKPLIPVNHLIGHFYANWIENQGNVLSIKYYGKEKKSEPLIHTTNSIPQFPTIGLLVSGGHTDLIFFKDHGKYEYLGGTRDDAAGECFDKCARLLGLSYPGGPAIAKLAEKGNPDAIKLPRPMIDSKDFDFSFSGLKTAVANLVHSSQFTVNSFKNSEPTNQLTNNLCASIQQAIIDVLVAKTIRAAQTFKINQIIVAGGVAANQELIRNLKFKIKNLKLKTKLFVPPPLLCTDNAAMIASAAFFQKPTENPLFVQAEPTISL